MCSRPSGPTADTWVTYAPDFAQLKMRGTSGEHDDGARRVGLELSFVEPDPQPDVVDTGDDRVAAILRDAGAASA
jgi:hypothetical protein